MGWSQDVEVLTGPRRFGADGGRADQALADGVGADRGGQAARNAADRTVKRQFAYGGIAGDGVRRDGAHGDHECQYDREVVVAALLGQVGRREVYGEVLEGQAEPDGVKRAADALTAFRHRLVGQPDDGEGGRARGDANLHLNRTRLDANECQRGYLPVHGLLPCQTSMV